MLKIIQIFVIIIFFSHVASASDLTNSFVKKYNDLKPPENSSVHSDYLFEQISLGSVYTVKMLDSLITQNINIEEKADVLIEKLDILIDQNTMIIKLLKEKNSKD